MNEPQIDAAEAKRRRKQRFLQQVIVETRYDRDDFTDFLDRRKSNAADIDQWNPFELEKMVDEYKRQPEIYFSHQMFDVPAKVYTSAEVAVKGNGTFEFEVTEIGKRLTRSVDDLEWTLNAFAAEFPFLFVPKLHRDAIMRNGQFRQDAGFTIKCHLEYLFVFYFGLRSAALKSFFNYSEEELELARKVC